jgi:hypothetical protein
MTEIVQVLVILFGSLVFFRVLGFAGIDRFTTWTVCARIALATMLLFTAIFSIACSWARCHVTARGPRTKSRSSSDGWKAAHSNSRWAINEELCSPSRGRMIAYWITISLILAARHNRRIVRIIPINPYDYHLGKGMARASLLGRLVVGLAAVPVVGDTVMRLRNYVIMKNILAGGVSDRESISPALMKEMYRVGNRRGHYRAFINLLRHSSSWEHARSEYTSIDVPTFMIWGAEDWALPEERRYDESLIPGVQSVTVGTGGHFLPLDAPSDVVRHIRSACRLDKR